MFKRSKFYIDPELQFPLIGWLILLVTLEGLWVGWGFHRAISLTWQWERPDQLVAFFTTISITIIPIVILNFLIGSYLTHKIAGPLEKIRQAVGQVSKGNLEGEVLLEEGEMLASYAESINVMIRRMRHILYRDNQFILEVNQTLTRCQKSLSTRTPLKPKERKELKESLNHIKSTLSIVATYFMRGKREKA